MLFVLYSWATEEPGGTVPLTCLLRGKEKKKTFLIIVTSEERERRRSS